MQSSNLETLYVTDSDAPKPPTNTEFPRLYGHLLCPFVEKVRLALAARAVKYQTCQLDLGKKTSWHIGYNGGFVPFWETVKGDIIIESKIVMDFIEDSYPDQGYSFLPADPVQRAQNRLGYSLVEALNGAWYPLYMKKAYDEAGFKVLIEKLQKIEDFIAANNKNPEKSSFAQGTDNPTQLDAHIYVHVVRIYMTKGSVWNDAFYENVKFENFPRIVKLLEAIRARPEFQGDVLANPKPWHEFLARSSAVADGSRLQLYLPISNE